MNAHTRAEALRLVDQIRRDVAWLCGDPGEHAAANCEKLRALLSASDDVQEGRRIAIARDEFFASLSGATLTGAPTGVYLRNRLELAFIEGWKAAKRDAAAPPPNGETK